MTTLLMLGTHLSVLANTDGNGIADFLRDHHTLVAFAIFMLCGMGGARGGTNGGK